MKKIIMHLIGATYTNWLGKVGTIQAHIKKYYSVQPCFMIFQQVTVSQEPNE